GLGVDDEIDIALPMQRDILALVPGDCGEAHLCEQAAQLFRVRGCIFDELEAVGTHRILEAQRAELDGRGGAYHDKSLLFWPPSALATHALQGVGRAMDIPEGWSLTEDGKALERTYRFKDFSEAFAFLTRVAM